MVSVKPLSKPSPREEQMLCLRILAPSGEGGADGETALGEWEKGPRHAG